MRPFFTSRFIRSLKKAPSRVRLGFYKQLANLLQDFRYPSLQVKKYDEARDIWQARVNQNWRFYFTIEKDVYNLIDIVIHPK